MQGGFYRTPASATNCAPMPPDRPAVTDDAMLGGRVRLLQPKRGHRFGHDAVLLAASIPAKPKDRAVEFGAGVGAASLALLARVNHITVTMVEIDPVLAALAAENIARNGFAQSARALVLDAGAGPRAFSAKGLAAGSADHVFMNPPFNDETRPPSPDRMKSRAHVASHRLLARWTTAATRLLRASGKLTVIWRADGLHAVLEALSKNHGSISILPVHGKEGDDAIRVIVQAVKGGRAPLTLATPLFLNGKDNRPTAEAEMLMRTLAPTALGDGLNRRRGGGST
jgi:tRNA1(Val) A37 N6-methylase TrmN6